MFFTSQFRKKLTSVKYEPPFSVKKINNCVHATTSYGNEKNLYLERKNFDPKPRPLTRDANALTNKVNANWSGTRCSILRI